MYHRLNPTEDLHPEQLDNGTLRINIHHHPITNNDSSDISAAGDDISYSSIDSIDNQNQNDAISYAPTADFQSCASGGSGTWSLNSNYASHRPLRRTFLRDVSQRIFLNNMNGNNGFEEGYDDFSRRTSVIFVSAMAFFGYLLLGTVAFTYYFKHWSPIDAMYFTVVTFTTCGYGDLVPVGDKERLFTLVFIILGITVLGGICLTVLFDNVFGYYEDMICKAKEKSTDKFMRESMVRIEKKEQSLYFQQSMPSNRGGSFVNDGDKTSYMEKIRPLFPFLIFISLGAGFIGYTEKWDVVSTLYFFVVTATSVGYGDIAPESQTTRLFAVIFIPCSVMIIAEMFARLIGVYLERKANEAEDEFLSRRMTLADFNRMDTDKNGSVTYDEFIKFFLVQMGKVKEEEINRLKELYDKFDVNNDGSIQIDDLVLMAKGLPTDVSP